MFRPTAKQYREFFAQHSSKGGMSTIDVNYNQEYSEINQEAVPPGALDMNEVFKADTDVFYTRGAFANAKRRRACPP